MRRVGSTPNCPALACAGGNIVQKIEDPNNYGIPQAIWDQKGYSSLWCCGYCGFIWYQTMEVGANRPFQRTVSVGFYNGTVRPGFVEVRDVDLKRMRSR
jgi:hypothetical protein